MKIEINFTELENFKEELEKAYKNIDPIMREISKSAMLLLHREISNLTPVDTGTLRNAWTIENTIAFKNGNTYELTLSNNISYGWYVNYGHRLTNGKWWEGYHFVETGELYVKENMEKLIQNSIEKYFKKVNGVD